jgi:hypothetical protein
MLGMVTKYMIDGKYADCLPDDVVMDTTKLYLEIYETIIGKPFS